MEHAQPQAGQGANSARPGLARMAALCLVGFAAVNLLVWLWVRAVGIEAQPVDLQTRLVYRLRLDSFFAGEAGEPRPRAVFVGDSFVHGAHLREREGPSWPRHTLSEQFARSVSRQSQKPLAALNLGVDGVLFSDQLCIVTEVLARKPEVLVVVVSPRPLAAAFASADGESARPFLCPAHAGSAGPSALARLGEHVAELAYRSVPVQRYRDLLQLYYLETTPRALVLEQLTSRLSAADADAEAGDQAEAAEEQAVLAQLLQRTRAAQRLASVDMDSDHPQARALEQLLYVLKRQTQTRVLVVYLRENLAALTGAMDVPRYERVAQRFSAWVQARLAGASRCRFVVESAEQYAGEYTDHIHLTSRGYARLAERLAAELPP